MRLQKCSHSGTVGPWAVFSTVAEQVEHSFYTVVYTITALCETETGKTLFYFSSTQNYTMVPKAQNHRKADRMCGPMCV